VLHTIFILILQASEVIVIQLEVKKRVNKKTILRKFNAVIFQMMDQNLEIKVESIKSTKQNGLLFGIVLAF